MKEFVWDKVYLKLGKSLLIGDIVQASEVDGILHINYEDPDYYFKGTLALVLAEGQQYSTNTFCLTFEDHGVSKYSVVGEVQRVPGLITYSGDCAVTDGSSGPWEVRVQYFTGEV